MTKTSKSFTLVELILVVGLLAISFGVTSDILISLIRSQAKTQILNDLEQQSNFVSLKLEKELRNATDVSSVGTNSLTITLRDTTVITYSLSTGVINREVAGGVTLPITDKTIPGGVTVACLGSCFSVTSGSPKTVSINLRFSPIGGGLIPSNMGNVDIRDTIVVRSTY